MNENAEQQRTTTGSATTVGTGYPLGQLAKALTTARTHHDPEVRARAGRTGERWRAVLSAMTDGRLTVGSRTPVAGLPAWVTLEVAHGGFATGAPSAGGPLQPYERETARRAGLPADRRALFDHFLTEEGLSRLGELLDSGAYEVAVPEEAALLTVAWLGRAGETDAAVDLVGELEPFADRLRFLPRPAERPAPGPDTVHRVTVGHARAALNARGPHRGVEAQREALAVWHPFGDALLTHWLETAEDGVVLARVPDDAWRERGAALLRRYQDLAARHTYCTRHRDPRQNLGVLRAALEEAVAGRTPDARLLGLLRAAVTGMVRKRGVPGSPRHAELRRVQAVQAALPSHHRMARLVADRLAELPQDTGLTDVAGPTGPVTAREAAAGGPPAGTIVPPAVRRPVEAALSAPVATLVERGVVPSAEVLAQLTPQLVGAVWARGWQDASLRTLTAAVYRAFRGRRSLLLLNLASQVRVEELPWIRAVVPLRRPEDGGEGPAAVLRELGELALTAFPGTLLPNPLVRELGTLARQSGLDAPMVEELAADIFMGSFSPKFAAVARIAGELLAGTPYERYYGLDEGALDAADFAALCSRRARDAAGGAVRGSGSVAADGMVIEQAQILTTHNLATLVARARVAPRDGWEGPARDAFLTVWRLVERLENNPRPLGTVKDAAYAWRQAVFFLSLCSPPQREGVLAWLAGEADGPGRRPARVTARLAPAVRGLLNAAVGEAVEAHGGRRFLGWTVGPHWLLEGIPRPARR
ncbi:hypothetical protein ABT026_28665 [Streptomyces sp. NPDC002734]|uniref:hypothetical protein n=1 Tax=Streptomyces sp. NPDC002734 TaxID=3154426 RepID=UPI0033235967